MLKILIVEDDEKISSSIADFLEMDFEVTQVFDGFEGIYEIESGVYDLVVLDWMLPEKSGIDILKEVRSEKFSTPILMLTAKDGLEDRIKGFKFGADDYLTKPFYLEELKMRIISLLKRAGKMRDNTVLTYYGVSVNLGNRSVTYGTPDNLEVFGKEFDLLVYFIQNQGSILTKEQIFDRIWGFDSETAITVVEVYMSKMRKHLKGTEVEQNLQTLRNVGYLLKKEVL